MDPVDAGLFHLPDRYQRKRKMVPAFPGSGAQSVVCFCPRGTFFQNTGRTCALDSSRRHKIQRTQLVVQKRLCGGVWEQSGRIACLCHFLCGGLYAPGYALVQEKNRYQIINFQKKKMRKKHLLLVCLVFLIGLPLQAQIQRGPTREKADYEAAARFSMKKVRKMVFSTGVRPVWFKNSDLFWYTYKTPQGESWYVADPVK